MKKKSKNFLLLMILATVSVALMAQTTNVRPESQIDPCMRVVEKNGAEHFHLLKHRPSIILGQDSITILSDDFVTHEIGSLSHIFFTTQISPYVNKAMTGVTQISEDTLSDIKIENECVIITHSQQSKECSVSGLDGKTWIKTKTYSNTYNRISLSNIPSGWYIIKSGKKSIKYHKP